MSMFSEIEKMWNTLDILRILQHQLQTILSIREPLKTSASLMNKRRQVGLYCWVTHYNRESMRAGVMRASGRRQFNAWLTFTQLLFCARLNWLSGPGPCVLCMKVRFHSLVKQNLKSHNQSRFNTICETCTLKFIQHAHTRTSTSWIAPREFHMLHRPHFSQKGGL